MACAATFYFDITTTHSLYLKKGNYLVVTGVECSALSLHWRENILDPHNAETANEEINASFVNYNASELSDKASIYETNH
jgi:hypothetical protein